MMTVRYPQQSLGKFFRVKHGFAFKGEHFVHTGEFVLLTPGNFEPQGGLKLKGDKEKYYDGQIPPDYILRRGDLIVAMTDLIQNAPILGAPALVPEDNRFLHNQRLGKVVDLDQRHLDKRYLYYLLNFRPTRDQLKGTATGATVKHTAPERIYRVEAPVPHVAVQRRIADILSAYDDLIENNTKRIKILEEMARSLYREWFVNFRFPGHEKVKMVSSALGKVPEGWRVVKLGDEIELAYGKGLKEDTRRAGEVPVYGSSGVVGWHDEPYAQAPGIIVGRKGNVGSVHWSDIPFFPIDTVYFVRTALPMEFVFFNLQTQNFINNDSAVPGLSRSQAYGLPLLVPDARLLARFVEFQKPIFAELLVLRRASEALRAARDLLLPRLISGEVSVISDV